EPDLLPGHERAWALEEACQQAKRQLLRGDALAAAPQLSRVEVQLEGPELDGPGARRLVPELAHGGARRLTQGDADVSQPSSPRIHLAGGVDLRDCGQPL